MFKLWPISRMAGVVRRLSAVWIGLLALPGFSVAGEPETDWVFEGLLNEVDPLLAPDLVSGWVLSGSFRLNPLELEEEPAGDSIRTGRLTGGLHGAELTVDLYRQVRFAAQQRSGLAGVDYVNNDPEHEGRDLLGWFIPVDGELGTGEWRLQWLQAWLVDPAGKMLPTAPPAFPPGGFTWRDGWFQLVFRNSAGETARAGGVLEVFSPEVEPAAGSADTAWEAVVAGLSNRLLERDREVAELAAELNEARARLEGLRRMVDLLVDERSHLEADSKRLREALEATDPQLAREQMTELEVRNALLEEDLARVETLNVELETRLADLQRERGDLRQKLAVRSAEAEEEPEPTPLASMGRVQSPMGLGEGVLTVFEQPMIIERIAPRDSVEPADAEAVPLPVEPVRDASPKRRPGPRKFR
jgi:hypothetical protein